MTYDHPLKMIEINLVQIFRPWHSMEFERTIVTQLDETQADKIIQKIQNHFPFYQLELKNDYFFEARKIDVRPIIARQKKEHGENLWRTQVVTAVFAGITVCTLSLVTHRYFKNQAKIVFFGAVSFSFFVVYRWSYPINKSFYPDNTSRDRENFPFDVILYRVKGNRIPPKNFDISSDDDPLTCERISPEKFDSPHVIFLPSYITNARGCVRHILIEGTAKFLDPFDRRAYSEKERKEIFQQITRIFGISKDAFISCFDSVTLTPLEYDYRGVDKDGKYTSRAKDALNYAINELEDSSLKEIEAFFDSLEKKIEGILEALRENASFREEFYKYVRLSNLPGSQEVCSQQFSKLFSSFGPPLIIMTISLGSGDFIRPVYLPSFFKLSTYQFFGPDSLKEGVDKALKKLKKQYIREIRLEILEMTTFNEDLKKEDEGNARVERFERLTGISLSILDNRV
ncbi:MAG: hypothetical protein H7A41_06280 [Chlamydiales bacterium]|nr:hypothetical protein [Chlamydiales bacterium]